MNKVVLLDDLKSSNTVLNQNFSTTSLTTIADLSTIDGVVLDSIIDVINTSDVKSLSFQLLANNIVLYGGVIPPQRTISLDTQRSNLVIQANGDGTINMITKKI
ncbi:hypothetical protein ACJDU8_17095 [Clostridium sp. WILCCON 0269]|uniref:Uncharacterized protein n=1 Tax=Candidatus Clostridium eludens TaxID=3381663 RepID=A0ABW8SMK4_9CLOT